MTELETVIADGYLGELAARPVAEIRSMRADCTRIETGLSYLRRLVQGRVDIVTAELQRRHRGDPPSGLPELIGQLPEIFSEQRRPGGVGRLPATLDVPEVDPMLGGRLEELAGPRRLASLLELSDSELAALRIALEDLEQDVSDRRRTLFDRIDRLQAELTERYRTGEATVDSLLAEP